MTFLSLLLALGLEQWQPLRSGNRVHRSYARYVNVIAASLDAGRYRDGVTCWIIAVIPVTVATWLVHWALGEMHGLLGMAWNVVILYLALGFRQFSHYYHDVAAALKAGDLAAARARIGEWRGASGDELTASEVARVAIEMGLLRSHRHVFGVLAWFAVFGAAGAIVYRLAALLSDRWGGKRDADARPSGDFAQRAFEVIDWVPVRLTAIGFAVAGDFMGAVESWREQAASWRPRPHGIILAAAAGALGVVLGGVLHQGGGIDYRPLLGDGDEADTDYMQAAVGLIWRALVLWLFLVLLVTIASWF